MRMLIVHDDVAVRDLVAGAVDDPDGVEGCADAAQALERLRAAPVDVVVLDLPSSGRPGSTLLADIRGDARLVDLPVVVLTARTGERDHLAAYRGGADAYLTIPLDPGLLRTRLAELTGSTPKQRVAERQRLRGQAELLVRIESTFSR